MKSRDAPSMTYPAGASKELKAKMLREWSLEMELWRAESIRAAEAEWVAWLSADDDHVCAACKSADGRIIPISQLDVTAHFADCTNPDGCRCVCGPSESPPLSYRRRKLINIITP